MPLPQPLPPEIDAASLDAARRAGETLTLLDVREPHEWAICGFADALRIPLGELGSRWGELPSDRPLVVYCRSGARSLSATRFLRAQGLTNATNLRGGILAWAQTIDPTWQTY